MGRLVVDASAIVEYLFRTRGGLKVQSFIEQDGESDLHIPAVCDLELVSAVRRSLSRGLITPSWADTIVLEYLSLPLIRHGHQLLLGRVLELRENLTAYDASYVALAERLEAPLVTADKALARAARTHSTIDVRGV
jgi:predicted nucleic acid-binding protein